MEADQDHGVMGSDWIWEMQVSVAAEPALRELYAMAAERDLRPNRPDGLINLFSNPDGDLRTVEDLDVAIAAMATGKENGQFWASGDVDIFVNFENGTLTWALDSVYCYRHPVPEADTFRELHDRLTGLWLDAALRLNVDAGRVLDEWSTGQIWDLGIHEAVHPVGGWPSELGWWSYLGPTRHLPAPPLVEVADRVRVLPNGAVLVTLLDDPASVDVLRYEEVHIRWLRGA
ncbi:hypothetical protein Aca07nite_39110 [Actinoplanes capillaceus]|uniref:Immunity protein 52 n=1 Tax=Actinoplanes campanulatus TaxID=113559 RepID=A0ABQ3WK69_9ACTN|nr:hypothetical protein Aca07nite_39110 [Actinoplanes capillaceus]